MSAPLAAGDVTLDATGRGELALPSPPVGYEWLVSQMAVSSTSAAVPICKVYRGAEMPSTFVAGTASGNGDTNDLAEPLTMHAGEYLTFVWEGGTPGALATARIEGASRGIR